MKAKEELNKAMEENANPKVTVLNNDLLEQAKGGSIVKERIEDCGKSASFCKHCLHYKRGDCSGK